MLAKLVKKRLSYEFTSMKEMTPKKIYDYLEKHIVGQEEAKKAISIALRTRWRRYQLDEELKEAVIPKNLLLVGPTGCGKTELARKLAKLTNAPFIKVEATKFTEIGYHGKDVETMIQDLVRNSVRLARRQSIQEMEARKQEILDIIYEQLLECFMGVDYPNQDILARKRAYLRNGDMDDRFVTIEIPEELELENQQFISIDEFIQYLKTIRLTGLKEEKSLDKHIISVKEAKEFLLERYQEKIISDIDYKKGAIKKVEEEGIVFLDEIDKIALGEGKMQNTKSPSSDGVQRDLLPIIEGTTVATKYGDVRTDHILFIASGAFSQARPQDLMPELLGRLPIRVTLKMLTQAELVRILKEPQYNLLLQQQELLKQEGIKVEFTPEGIERLGYYASEANYNQENLGARRLHAMVEKVVEDLAFDYADHHQHIIAQQGYVNVVVDQHYIDNKLAKDHLKTDLNKYLI